MNKNEYIHYWLEESDGDSAVMQSLFDHGHYTWALFVGHLVLEKALKALYVSRVSVRVPRTHNLLRIALECGLSMTAEQEDFLLEVTNYNIKGRYPDYRRRFSRKATREFTLQRTRKIKEFQQWVKQYLMQ